MESLLPWIQRYSIPNYIRKWIRLKQSSVLVTDIPISLHLSSTTPTPSSTLKSLSRRLKLSKGPWLLSNSNQPSELDCFLYSVLKCGGLGDILSSENEMQVRLEFEGKNLKDFVSNFEDFTSTFPPTLLPPSTPISDLSSMTISSTTISDFSNTCHTSNPTSLLSFWAASQLRLSHFWRFGWTSHQQSPPFSSPSSRWQLPWFRLPSRNWTGILSGLGVYLGYLIWHSLHSQSQIEESQSLPVGKWGKLEVEDQIVEWEEIE